MRTVVLDILSDRMPFILLILACLNFIVPRSLLGKEQDLVKHALKYN